MEQDDDDMFWLRPTTPRHCLRRSSSSIFFSSGSFVILLLAVALAFIFVIIPSLHSLTSQIFRPNAVKKSWDSLNFLLLLFAILCGFLGRNTAANTDDDVSLGAAAAAATPVVDKVKSNIPSTPPRQWYEYSDRDRTAYNDPPRYSMMNRVSSMRSSSSYPDLRQQDTDWVARDDRWRRFNDDTHVSNYRAAPDRQVVKQHRRRASWHEFELGDAARTKNIPVDTFVIRTEQVPSSKPPMPDNSAPPPPEVQSPSPPCKSKRTYQAVPEKESSRNDDLDVPPREAAFPAAEVVEIKRGLGKNIVKKKGVALETTKEFLITSIKGKKKKRRQVKSIVENFDNSASPSSYTTPLYAPLSPPPPPSVFQNLFSAKKPKQKKTHNSVSQPPLSPPVTTSSATRLPNNKAQIRPTTTFQKPPLPVKEKSFNVVEEENQNSGGESPLMSHIPPPPPLPPFRMPETKYVVVHSDFVRIKSNNSSRSGSPDLSDGGEDSPTNETSSLLSGNESPARPMFCPSPDVNTKADTFIARFRAGLRLEKINSVRVRSNLGPDPSAEEELGP